VSARDDLPPLLPCVLRASAAIQRSFSSGDMGRWSGGREVAGRHGFTVPRRLSYDTADRLPRLDNGCDGSGCAIADWLAHVNGEN